MAFRINNQVSCSVLNAVFDFRSYLSLFSSLCFQIQNPLDLFRNHGLLDAERPTSHTVCHVTNIFDSILGILCCFIGSNKSFPFVVLFISDIVFCSPIKLHIISDLFYFHALDYIQLRDQLTQIANKPSHVQLRLRIPGTSPRAQKCDL